jgi:predicted AAA+ superfamily ATPase
MIERILEIDKYIKLNKVLVIYGPRQVGKTTLIKKYLHNIKGSAIYKTGDDLVFANDFGQCSLNLIKKIVPENSLFIIDEAQKIPNIGRALKLLVDNVANVKVLVTGSSAFDLANRTSEALTGRKTVCILFPISLQEAINQFTAYEIEKKLTDLMIYGMYPEVMCLASHTEKVDKISEIAHSYLLKDLLEFDTVKSSGILMNLLKLIAFQIGSEVSTTELAKTLGIDKKTVMRYLDLLEKSFVLFSLRGFSRNLRKEVSKMGKYYFYDLGIRNALISNFNDIDTRNDVGQLWENFMIIERMKNNSYMHNPVNYYFWRTYSQKEIDLIEEHGGKLYGYEFKWKKANIKAPSEWLNTYKNASFEIISNDNYLKFIKA